MEQNDHHHHHHQLHHQPRPSRQGLTNTGGEIVEVNGGHIVRSTGRKDRHSKVCTAKGTRDRRVRLSAHTAIQFYDVQDRLGYDRPSKAVDWLINKAKASIDELAELPPWKPTAGLNLDQNPNQESLNHRRLSDLEEHPDDDFVDIQMGSNQNSGLLPASIDSIKSFFPAGGSSTPAGNNNNDNNNNNNNNNSSGMQFHHSFPQSELITRPGNPNQDLKLSLQSFQDPISHHQTGQGNNNNNNNMYFDGGSSWPENGGFSGFVFSSPATQTTPFMQPLYGHPTNSQLLSYISQRGPLQSSNTPPVRAWVDPPIDQHPTLAYFPGFSSGLGGFPGQHFPARTGDDEEEHDGVSDKPSSASSDSHH